MLSVVDEVTLAGTAEVEVIVEALRLFTTHTPLPLSDLKIYFLF